MSILEPLGLTALSTTELKKLLGHCYRNELAFPITVQSIACIGFQYKQGPILNTLRRLDKESVCALLVCVIAERIKT